MKKGDKVLGKDLKPGMMVSGFPGLILSVDLEGKDEFFDGKPSYHMFDLNDPYYGPCVAELDPEQEFTILYEQNTPEYRKAVDGINTALVERIKYSCENIEELKKVTGEYYEDKKADTKT